MAQAIPGVGDPVQSRCTKCKVVTRHLVVSLMEGKPARVQCVMCEGFHNYRPPREDSTAKTPRTGGRTPVKRGARVSAVEQEFDTVFRDLDASRALHYSMDGSFRSGDVIAHPTFGLGLVRRLIPPGKIEVLFRDGIRLLRASG